MRCFLSSFPGYDVSGSTQNRSSKSAGVAIPVSTSGVVAKIKLPGSENSAYASPSKSVRMLLFPALWNCS
jgi:hypothetical protein